MTHRRRGVTTVRAASLALAGVMGCALLAPGAWAADAAAGKTVAQAKCGACHEPADWKGETDASLQSLLRDVVSGKVKHQKLKVELSDTDIANVAAYWLTTKK